ncbi:MAG TPA: hypothetical protein VFW83_03040, partial [Bryobacteraceae bacterium]|nr:hypothetical protein [Bryobacteraceae bacterium]
MQPMLQKRGNLHRLALPEASKKSWLPEISRLAFPNFCSEPRDLSGWRAFVHDSTRIADRWLPPSFRDALDRFFSNADADALLIENLPVDPGLPCSPTDGKRPASKGPVSEAVIVG